MRPVTVYTSETCTLCHSVENLFNVREIPYEKVLLLEDSPQHEELIQRSGMKTLPQVFIGSLLLGGYQETLAADQAGMLADLLVD
ncbi:MAG TPA: glutaredoxin domain-containing protein [Solirubrobacteraceae bacterium]|nr:glutaredoxin domain-containing protein [Solirubrobacteraceae bacterium]